MGLFTMGLALAGGAVSAFGEYEAGKAREETAEYNAKLMRQQAEAVEASGKQEREILHDQSRELKATQRAGASKAGADITSGTPLMSLLDQAGKMQFDILQHQRNSTIEANKLRSGAKMSEYEGKQARRASYIGMFSSLLGGGYKASQAFGGTSIPKTTESKQMLTHIESLPTFGGLS